MEYYIFNTKEEAREKVASIYDLYCVQPRVERVTVYCYFIYTNGTDFALAYDGSYDAQGLLDGLTPETEQEVINQGYNLSNSIIK
jgi:hypothetical protein